MDEEYFNDLMNRSFGSEIYEEVVFSSDSSTYSSDEFDAAWGDQERPNAEAEEQDEAVLNRWRASGVEHMNKRRSEGERVESNEQKRKRTDDDDDDPKEEIVEEKESEENLEPACCSVCLEDIDGGGDHRLVALRCGHPFGQSCVTRWLQTEKKCPMCNSAAKVEDIRVVFLDRYKVGSSYDLAETKKELGLANQERDAALKTSERLQIELNALKTENQILRDRVRYLEKHGGSLFPNVFSSGEATVFPHRASFTQLSGGCKFMAYSENLNMVAVSARAQTGPFMGYTVEICSLFDPKSRNAKLLHYAEIKDLGFHKSRPWLLTASLDNHVKISEIVQMSMTSVQSYRLPVRVWSCCWSEKRETNFYAGLQTGVVNEYDIRSMNDPVQTIGGAHNRQPVVSLRAFKTNDAHAGFVCSELRNSVRLYHEADDATYASHYIPASGNCFALSFNQRKRALMVSTRISRGVMNEIFSLGFDDDGVPKVSPISNFRSGGSAMVLVKPTLCSSPKGSLWACCLDDSAKSIQVFNGETANCEHTLNTKDPENAQFFQVENVTLPGQSAYALIGLSENGLSFYS